VEVRSKKDVSKTAILMALSRMQKRMEVITPKYNKFKVDNISIASDLCIVTYKNNPYVHQMINRLYRHIQKQKGYITITRGMKEVTAIFDKEFLPSVKRIIKEEPTVTSEEIASIGITFDEKYVQQPGLLYSILQQITIQNINVVEIASTYTEFILYIDKKHVKLAFDTLFHCF